MTFSIGSTEEACFHTLLDDDNRFSATPTVDDVIGTSSATTEGNSQSDVTMRSSGFQLRMPEQELVEGS